MTKGQRLETKPASEVILTGVNTEKNILMPNTMTAFPVYSRFIGSDHSRQNSLTVEILTDFLRAFVDVEVETHSVASPVTEIPLGVP